ncbi:zinc ABC transporter substrate-binding protein ZnuA [Rhizobium alvei]|uniref:High-affinity zinc uptake system protein ZnuA n=1 Tax=Rhizobium alvei TaxID=1132659 RepID=A0ABT8YHZ5_9HYPH|nr:zinc ABC transporter substrate-binding protein ZnuA [Rhizobium alvei]MDO6963251.1 zinc ABC transporter substrate-binding protein ZnuA [Rhizobium alvei]
MSNRFTTALLAATILAALPLTASAAPRVITSIKPIHSLAAAIMKGVGEPGLIVEGAASPHTYSMKPSDAERLQDAEIVFWVGHGLEGFLEKPLETLGSKATIVELEDVPGMTRLKFREGGPFEAHDHGDEEHHEEAAGHDHEAETAEAGHDHEAEGHEHDHHESEFDMHSWLSIPNAKAMATAMEQTLAKADPANASAYAANLKALDARLDALAKDIEKTIAPVKDKPFVVFHDAYQYFEHDFGVKVAGSITVSPETMPGADRIRQIHAKVAELKATCVFAEPQFEPKLINVVIEGTDARSGTLDPEGGSLVPGENLYFDLMQGIATNLAACLGK